MIQRKIEDGWANQYSFDNLEICQEDIQISNYYTSTHPNSHFYNNNYVGKFTSAGRIGISNNKMSIRKGTTVIDEKSIPYGPEWIDVLKTQFNLEIDFTEKELEGMFKMVNAK